jgi:hypothetical protein
VIQIGQLQTMLTHQMEAHQNCEGMLSRMVEEHNEAVRWEEEAMAKWWGAEQDKNQASKKQV